MIKPTRKRTQAMKLTWIKQKTAWTIIPPVKDRSFTGDQYQGQFDHYSKSISLYPSISTYENLLEQFPELEIDESIEDWYFNQCVHLDGIKRLKEYRDKPYAYELDGWNDTQLYPHQRHTIEFLKNVKRAMCLDEVGLGKTVSTLIALGECIERSKQPVTRIVIVCLGKLQKQWHEEQLQWFPYKATTYNICNQSKTIRTKLWNTFLHSHNKVSIAYINWEALRLLDLNQVKQGTISYLIGDEAQALRNRKSKQTIAFKDLSNLTDTVWMLTGTPIEKSPHELWSLLNILNPKWFRSYWNFFNCFVDYELTGGAGYITPVGIREENKSVLHEVMSQYSIRHTRQEEFKDLKEVQTIFVPVELTRKQRKLYQELKQSSYIPRLELTIPHGAARLLRLRQVINTPHSLDSGIGSPVKVNAKLEVLEELIETIPENDQIVIFCSFLDTLKLLEDQSIAVPYYADDLNKNGILRNFQSGIIRTLSCTPQSLGTGANLQNANVLIHFDIPVSSLLYKQDVGRIDRIGQKKVPIVYNLVAENTVDEIIQDLLSQKVATFDETIVTQKMLEEIQS